VEDAEGAASVGPHQDQRVLAFGDGGQGFLDVGGVLYGVAVDFDDYVAALEAGVIGGAAGLDLLDDRAVQIAAGLDL